MNTILALPTKRIRDMAETLKVFDANMTEYNHDLPITIFDDSPKTLSDKYIPSLKALGLKRDIAYVGQDAKNVFLAELKSKLKTSTQNTLIDDMFRPCYGGNRNYTALFSLGKIMISLDDDMRPYALMTHQNNNLEKNEVSRGCLVKLGSNDYSEKGMDVFTAYTNVIGKKISDLDPSYTHGKYLIDTAMDLETNATMGLANVNSLFVEPGDLSPNATVKMAQAYRTGTNDIDAIDFVDMFIEDDNQLDFKSHIDLYALDNFQPAITDINWRMDCGVAAYDNRDGIPPFIPSSLRFEDYLYRLWIQQPDFCAAHVGTCFTHLKSTYMRHPHASEVFNEEIANLIKRKMLKNGFKAKTNTVEFDFDGYITLEDTTVILDKIKATFDKAKTAIKRTHSVERQDNLKYFIAALQDMFFDFDNDMFHLEISRIVKREFSLIDACTRIWPTILEVTLDNKLSLKAEKLY